MIESRISYFGRTLANESKAGAYYTDIDHCTILGTWLEFAEGETCCLEPSAGNGAAMIAVTGKVPGDNKKLFGVELQGDAAQECENTGMYEKVLQADFLTDVTIRSDKAPFSFVFSNPPYMDGLSGDRGTEKKERMELTFLKEITPRLANDGVLVYVVPFARLKEEDFVTYLLSRYEIEKVFRFLDKEYEKFKQVAILCRKKGYLQVNKDKAVEFIAKWVQGEPELIHVRPEGECALKVPASSTDNIRAFRTRKFDERKALEMIKGSSLFRHIDGAFQTERFVANTGGQPIVELSEPMSYNLAVCGIGGGRVTESILVRGSVKEAETETYEKKGTKDIVKVVKSKQTQFIVVQDCGQIDKLV